MSYWDGISGACALWQRLSVNASRGIGFGLLLWLVVGHPIAVEPAEWKASVRSPVQAEGGSPEGSIQRERLREASSSARAILGDMILVGDGVVRLGGVPAFWGSAVPDGSEIETTSSLAFVRLRDGRGVIAIGPASRVQISRQGARLRLHIFYGTATIRSREDVEVQGPDRSFPARSEREVVREGKAGELLYALFVREGKMEVASFEEPLGLKEAARMVLPEVAYALAAVPLGRTGGRDLMRSSPGPMPVLETTERSPLVISCRTEKLFGHGLRVVGRVALGTTPIGGAPVIVRALFRNRLPGMTVANVVTGADGPLLGHYQVLLAATPADLAAGGVVEVVTQVGQEIAANRCGF